MRPRLRVGLVCRARPNIPFTHQAALPVRARDAATLDYEDEATFATPRPGQRSTSR